MKQKLLIVDDDDAIRTQMKWALSNYYEILLAEDHVGALSTFRRERPAVTLLDLGLPPRPNDPDEGLATLSEILSVEPQAKVIIISGQGEKKNALEAVGAGAYDFLCKPVDVDELTLILRRCIHVVELEREYREMQQRTRSDVFEDMLGASSQMQGCSHSFARWRGRLRRCSCSAKAEPGKKWRLLQYITEALGTAALSSPSTAMPFLKIFSKASYSVTKKGPSPARTCNGKASLNRLPAGLCSSMR